MNKLLIICLLLFSISCKSEVKEKNIPLAIEEETIVTEASDKNASEETTEKPAAVVPSKNRSSVEIEETPKSESTIKVIEKEAPRSDVNTEVVKTNKSEESKIITPKEIVKEEILEPKEIVEVQSNEVQVAEKKEEELVELKEEEVIEEVEVLSPFSHENWNSLLQKNVSSTGNVNYKSFKKDEAQLDQYLEELKNNTPQKSWSPNKIKAYWTNAYNAFTIKMILKNWPVKSIMDISAGKAWDDKWIEINGKTLSLNNIEHDILRATYNDARIHFAVNCAAKSCPPIWNNAWTETNIESTLEKMTKSFINNSEYNSLNKKSVNISKIFEWYASDFGDLVSYLNKYSEISINKNAQLNYKEYNWALNE